MNKLDSKQYHELCRNVYNSMMLLKLDTDWDQIVEHINEYLQKEGFKSSWIMTYRKVDEYENPVRVVEIEWRKE